MNKYQEAFNRIFNENTFGLDDTSYIKDGVIYKKDEEIIKELVDKENPMKVDIKDNKKIKCDKKLITLVTYYKCPNKKCKFHNNYKILVDEKRCPECGQKLDWSDKCE